MLAFIVLQATDTFAFVCVIGCLPYEHFYKTFHITFTLGGGLTGEEAAKSVVAVLDCISASVSVTPLDISRRVCGD